MEISHVEAKEEEESRPGAKDRGSQRPAAVYGNSSVCVGACLKVQEWKWKRSMCSWNPSNCGLIGCKHSVGRECIRYVDFEVLDPPANWQAEPGCLDKLRTKSEYIHMLFCFVLTCTLPC